MMIFFVSDLIVFFQMSKVNLVQSKAGGGVGGGATIVKLVTTQAGGTGGKPIMTTATTPGGQILTLPAGATTAQAKNMVQHAQHNIVIAKQQVRGNHATCALHPTSYISYRNYII